MNIVKSESCSYKKKGSVGAIFDIIIIGDYVLFGSMFSLDLLHTESINEFNYRFNTDFVVIKSKKSRKVN